MVGSGAEGFLQRHGAFLVVAAAVGRCADAGRDEQRGGTKFAAEAGGFLRGADKDIDARGDCGAGAEGDEILDAPAAARITKGVMEREFADYFIGCSLSNSAEL